MLRIHLFSHPHPSLKRVWPGCGYGEIWDWARTSCCAFPNCLPQGPSPPSKSCNASHSSFFASTSFAQTSLARCRYGESWDWARTSCCAFPYCLPQGPTPPSKSCNASHFIFFRTHTLRSNKFGSVVDTKKAVRLASNGFWMVVGGRWDSNPRPLVPQTSALTN